MARRFWKNTLRSLRIRFNDCCLRNERVDPTTHG